MLLLLLACAPDAPPSDEETDTSAPPSDTAEDTDDTGATEDTGDTALPDTADDDTAPIGDAYVWRDRATPDLSITACGTPMVGGVAVAPGPDLDGDGLAEIALGLEGFHAAVTNQGAVFLFRGADLRAGVTIDDALGYAVGPLVAKNTQFGESVEWVGDRDGDGVDDLLVSGDRGSPRWVVSGAALMGGGEVAVATDPLAEGNTVFRRWGDFDGDGRDDWLVGLPDRGMGGFAGNRGVLGLASDVEFGVAIPVPFGREVAAEDLDDHAGTFVAVLGDDLDGDGLAEPVTNLDGGVVVLDSGPLVDWVTYLEEAVRWRFLDVGEYGVLAPGDLDGRGAEDIVTVEWDTLCVGLGEDANDTDSPVTCVDTGLGSPGIVEVGPDRTGDGVADLLLAGSDGLVTLDGAALAGGAWVVVTELALPASAHSVAVDGDDVWLGVQFAHEWGAPVGAWRIDGSTTDLADALPIAGHGWGADPSNPLHVDLTGDNVDDLLVRGDVYYLFDGAALAAGGERTACEADATYAPATAASWDPSGALAIVDQDGDGADDLLLVAPVDDDVYPATYDVQVLSGARVWAGDDTPLSRWIGSPGYSIGCDLDGDGLTERYDTVDGRQELYDGGIVLTGDRDAARLARFDGDGFLGCVPDLDGDGLAEPVLEPWSDYAEPELYLSSGFDPDGWFTDAGPFLTFDMDSTGSWGAPQPLGDLDGDGLDDRTWTGLRRDDSTWRVCHTDPAAYVTGTEVTPALAWTACTDGFARLDGAWTGHLVGDEGLDLVLVARTAEGAWGFHAADAGELTGFVEVLPIYDTDDEVSWEAWAGPDLRGNGGASLWIAAESETMRPRIDAWLAGR